jgi:outer membrane protein OmpA-like peptidoglycan-associated protein
MNRRPLGLVVLLLVVGLGWSRVAHATLSPSPATVTITNQLVGTAGAGSTTFTHSNAGTDKVKTISPGAGCGEFAVTSTNPVIPGGGSVSLNNVDTFVVNVSFTPTTRGGPRVCTFTLMNDASTPVAVGSFQVSGTAIGPVNTVSPSLLDFGAVRLTAAPVPAQTVTIKNDGETDLTFGTVTKTGTGAADYTLSQDVSGKVLAPGVTATIDVTFVPGALGTRNATLTIPSDDPINPTKTVALNGSGTSAILGVSTTALNFGNLTAGTGGSLNLGLRNSGTGADVTVTSAVISTATSTWFTFTSTPTAGCSGNANCTFAPSLAVAPGSTNVNVGIRCLPPTGTVNGTTQMTSLTLTSDTDPGFTNTVTLTCTAVRPDISITPLSLTHDFGNVHVGTPSVFNSLVVQNVGGTTMTYAIAESGTNPGDFALGAPVCAPGACTAGSLAPNQSATYAITFTPAAQGARAATFTITSNDQEAADASKQFTVGGTGTRSVLNPTPANASTLAFGGVPVGMTSAGQTVTIANSGNEDLAITSANLSSSEFILTAGSSGAQTVTPIGPAASWTIACKPSSRGVKNGTFTVANSSSNQATYTVNLTCTGQGGNLTVAPALLDFGGVRVGTSQSKTFTLSNTGELPVTTIAAVVAPSNVGYSVMNVPTTLAAGTSQIVTVTFAPLSGADGGPATVTMTSNWNTVVENLNGDGQPFGIDVSCTGCSGNPLTKDFGVVRWDQTSAPIVFHITNTAVSPVSVQSVVLTSGANFTMTGAPTMATTLAGGADLPVTITAVPNDTMLGAFTAKLQVLTDLPPPNQLIETTLMVTSVSPALMVSPGMTVDFGGVDIDANTPLTKTITLANTGDGDMDLIGAPALTGVFTSAAVTASTVAKQGSKTVDVTYTPTTEKTAGAPDTNTLVLTIDGLIASGNPQPTAVQVQVVGHGTDRHVQLMTSPLEFPATFRNPGDAAPIESVDIMNTGEATLHMSAVMLTGDAQFTLLDTAPVPVAGGAVAHFRVQFAPTTDSGDFTAQLGISHDDNNAPTPNMSVAMLHGQAAARMVTGSPNTIDLGVTGVGVPVKYSDLTPGGVKLVNMDATRAFTIRQIKIAGDAANVFAFIDNSSTRDLAASATASYDVTFTPTVSGDYTATLEVYLDQDPTAQTILTIKGKAVDVEVRGGGCAAGGGGGWGGLALIGLALALRSRRGRRGAVLAALVLVIAARGPASAGPTRDVDLSTFSPAPTTEAEGFQIEGARVGVAGAWARGLACNVATNPLHVQSPQIVGMEDKPVTQRTAAELGFAYAFAGRFEVGVRVPMLQQAGEAPHFSGLTPADGVALGDAALHLKAALLTGGPVAVAAAATMTVPTATGDGFTGAAGVTGHVAGIVGVTQGRIGAGVNAGFRVRKAAALGDIEQGNEFTYGATASFRATKVVSVVGELFGQYGVGGGASAGVSPLEVMGGIRYRMDNGMSLAAGAGRGLMPGIGAPDMRGFLMVSYAPHARKAEPLVIDHTPPPRPRDTGDADNDGIVNSDDKCPTDAEDKDGFQDDDGCPDPDNDGDGIPDGADKCPGEAEDKDGFQDDDGCPDLDNDGDGIPDSADKCPMEPEDKDGFQDNDGCDDPDNDNDGIPDVVDQCATEAETINGINDDDGCPDQGDSLVMVMADRIELFEPVTFNGLTAVISKKSLNVLGQVAATLRANRDFKRIRVTVHVQPRNDGDDDLSEQRAAAVRAWLIKWGIEAERIEAKGLGSARPLVPKASKGAAAINDRVEFILMEKR